MGIGWDRRKRVQVQKDQMAVGEYFVKMGAALADKKLAAGGFVEVADKTA